MKLWVVHWSNASLDDDGNCSAFGNVHGIYTSPEAARVGLVECKDDAIINNTDLAADQAYAAENIQVYGSEKEEYYEIDFKRGDDVMETYISIAEVDC